MGKADSVFEVIGPIMIGPSSSHTAAAVRIGQITGALIGEKVEEARIQLHGSFASTGTGHGTDKALAAGLLGYKPDDPRIRGALMTAENEGIKITFEKIDLGDDYHPNTVRLTVKGVEGTEFTVTASSLGGGTISVVEINGLTLELSGENDTLVTIHDDRPGVVAQVTSIIAEHEVNISTMNVSRQKRGGKAVMAIELDHGLPEHAVTELEKVVETVRVIPPIY